MRDFPREADAPPELQDLPSNCGPIAVWQVLRAHGVEPAPSELLGALRFDAVEGTFMIGIAVALSAFGFAVVFHTDPDPTPTPLEQSLYGTAQQGGIPIRPALPLAGLRERLEQGAHAIVLYEGKGGLAHITPLSGAWLGELIAPNEGAEFSNADFEERWARPGCYRQCVVVEGIAPVALYDRSEE
jgi:hypothetical protein